MKTPRAMREIRRSWMLGLCLLFACQDRVELSDSKRTPKPPPPASAEIPAGLSITVEIDGAPAAMIDHARLEGVKPDFVEEDKRAWRFSTLFSEALARPGVVVAVSGESGPEVLLRLSAKPGEGEPALLVSRRGDAVATMISPEQPFPGYHGRGGRLGRSGDPVPRIVGVRKIRIYLER